MASLHTMISRNLGATERAKQEVFLRFFDHAQTDQAEKGFDSSVNNPEKNMGYENLCQGY